MSKLFNLVSEIEFPSIYAICCSPRRKYQRYEKIIQQEKDKNEYLTKELKITKDALIKSYYDLLEYERVKLKECLVNYEHFNRVYERIKYLKENNKIEELKCYVFEDATIETIEEYYKKKEDYYYDLLDNQMKIFESLEKKIKMLNKII